MKNFLLAEFLVLMLVATSSESLAVSVVPGNFDALSRKVCTEPGNGELAPVDWQERSDWINVKTDVNPPARGDGIADDTAAIQAALDRIQSRIDGGKVVYFPPGDYRISRTLTVRDKPAGMLVGHGSLTRIFWDGRLGGRMFWSNGLPRSSYIGLVWDGNGIAGVGIDHDSKSRYETRVMHEHMEFRDFTVAGIRVGHNQKSASAEMMFIDLKFVNNRHGVLLESWNDYNNIFDGNHFVDNDFGIRAEKGNVTVRNSRFERSRETDLFLSTHSHSVRRVVSKGSMRFIETVRGTKANGPLRVEDSIVDGWRDTDGVIKTSLRGPVFLFNVDFINPPSQKPPVKLVNPRLLDQIAILANVNSPDTRDVIDEGPNGIVHYIPDGGRSSPRLPVGQVFLRNRFVQTPVVLDARQDCDAKGDGVHDDTRAIQDCIDRIAVNAKPVTLYFPPGEYRVTRTLSIKPGASFRMEGTGWHSRIVLSGKRPGTVLHVLEPDGLVISRMTLGGPDGTISLLQTGAQPSAVRYHNLFLNHQDEQLNIGMRLSGLPGNAVVVTDHIDGRIHVDNSSKAVILFGFPVAVQMKVSGNSPQSGFLGVLSRASALSDYPLVVQDNQSIVMTDWYNEQTDHLFRLEGQGSGAGSVIIDHTNAAFSSDTATSIKGFQGLLAETGGIHGQAHDFRARKIDMDEQSDTDVYLLGNMYWHKAPVISGGKGGRFVLGNSLNLRYRGINGRVTDTSPSTENRVPEIIDAFSTLGDVDLALNYCQ